MTAPRKRQSEESGFTNPQQGTEVTDKWEGGGVGEVLKELETSEERKESVIANRRRRRKGCGESRREQERIKGGSGGDPTPRFRREAGLRRKRAGGSSSVRSKVSKQTEARVPEHPTPNHEAPPVLATCSFFPPLLPLLRCLLNIQCLHLASSSAGGKCPSCTKPVYHTEQYTCICQTCSSASFAGSPQRAKGLHSHPVAQVSWPGLSDLPEELRSGLLIHSKAPTAGTRAFCP